MESPLFMSFLQKIDKATEDFLQKLKSRVLVGLVGGSDLVKIAEQMGGDDGKLIILLEHAKCECD